MDILNVGYSCFISKSRVVAIVEPSSSPIKRMIQDSRDNGTLIDATYGKKTKSFPHPPVPERAPSSARY